MRNNLRKKLIHPPVPPGFSRVPLSHLRGPVVLSLNAGVHSYARKIIIN